MNLLEMTRKKERYKIPFVYTGKANEHTEEELEAFPYVPICGLNLYSTTDLKKLITSVKQDYFVLFTGSEVPALGEDALERLIRVAEDSGAGLVYSNFQEIIGGIRKNHPVNDYQTGSIRDDFDFGPLLLIRTSAAKEVLRFKDQGYDFAGLYDLRLKISQKYPLVHLEEYLYTVEETDLRDSDEKMFAYVDPKNRAVQVEMEQACTAHLKSIGAWLPPFFETVDLQKGTFPVEASVIIPVRNRIKTISDAIRSVLEQVAEFKFNLIIVDNHSTDGTMEAIAKFAAKDNRIILVKPERQDLGIGGCWNVGVQHPECGRFAIQ
ncbi:MAG: glycosyltransferase family A protein, partial [Bacteroidia bacterium]|nr:glycosyltransferase family A protein [Bacteroidia bacterium]